MILPSSSKVSTTGIRHASPLPVVDGKDRKQRSSELSPPTTPKRSVGNPNQPKTKSINDNLPPVLETKTPNKSYFTSSDIHKKIQRSDLSQSTNLPSQQPSGKTIGPGRSELDGPSQTEKVKKLYLNEPKDSFLSGNQPKTSGHELLPSIIEVSPELAIDSEEKFSWGFDFEIRDLPPKPPHRSFPKHRKLEDTEPILAPTLPVHIWRDRSAVHRFFVPEFLNDIFSKTFKENQRLLGNVLLMSESFRNIQSVRILPVFVVADPKDMLVGIWELANALLNEAAPQLLFTGWVMWSFLIESTMLAKVHGRQLKDLCRQSLWIVLRKMALHKSSFGFGVMIEVLQKLMEKELLEVSEVVETIISQQASRAVIPDLRLLLPSKLAVLSGLAATILKCYPGAWKIMVKFAALALQSPKEGVRKKSLRLIATLASGFGNPNAFVSHILSKNLLDITVLPALKVILADHSPIIDSIQYQNTYFLNRRRNSLMRELTQALEEEFRRTGKLPLVQPPNLKCLSQEASLVPKPVKAVIKNLPVNSFKQDIRAKIKELESLRQAPLQKLTTCSFCLDEAPEFSDTTSYENHLGFDCPLLTICGACDTVVEVRELTSHRLTECPEAYLSINCRGCTLAVLATEVHEHWKGSNCTKLSSQGSLVCPLCFRGLMVVNQTSIEVWQEHLGQGNCPNQPRGRRAHQAQSEHTTISKKIAPTMRVKIN
jgi:hypothetical protein